MNYSTEELKNILLDNDYPISNPKLIESVIKQLLHLTPIGEKAFIHWQETRELPSFDIEGVTAEYLKSHLKSTDIAVILAYDGLVKNPKSAYILKKPVISHPNE